MSIHNLVPMTTEEWLQGSPARRNRELRQALVTRPLTVEELAEVGQIGYSLLVVPNQPFYMADVQREFQALLSIQQTIQIAAKADAK